ncbi:TrmH family RNA methyltransferase [Phaeodactylibacter luteus]|uniref:RNA methyltransferase n=1 Tax=Phaeodactylibacter luteus TaxID=1564516 RepID=A0A5C6RIE6_9BACT|nr:RNA methyltransferase [Phaeodactylibacter luteus]TXB61695.1 RNA methyltransferase [Phaeodactylibacter luteus]
MPISKNSIKFIKALRQKKFRQKYNTFVVEGDKMVAELLAQRPSWCKALYALPAWLAQYTAAEQRAWPFAAEVVSSAELERASLLKTPNQALALLEIPAPAALNGLDGRLSLFLDGLQDPGNMGTILRLADWFGISTVICAPNCVDAYNPKAVQSSMGAFLRVGVVTAGLGELLGAFPGLPVYGADMAGDNIFTVRVPPKGLLVIGNEGSGLSPETEQALTRRLSIPKGEGGGAESLNAAVATGIILGVLLHANV